jgi:hypothetical protein
MVYPNPAENIVTIECEDFSHFEVYSSDGKILHSGSDIQIDMRPYQAGIYLVKIWKKTGDYSIQKLICSR